LAANPQLIIRIAATIGEFKKNMAEGKAQVEALESSVEKMKKSWDGSRIAQRANDMVGALEDLANVSKLTEKEQAALNKTLGQALDKYQRLGKEAPKEWQLVYDATKKTTDQTKEAAKSVDGIGVAFGSFLGNLAGNVVSRGLSFVTAEMGRLWEASQKLSAVGGNFGRLASSMGADSGKMLDAIRDGTRGLVSNADMMAAANKAMLLGLPVTTESMGTMAEAATKLGRAMGQDATKSIDDLITALGRSSPMILDNLGLTVKVGEANDKYAQKLGISADSLTEAQRKTAFYEAAMEAARIKTAELGDVTLTWTEQIARGWTSVSNSVEKYMSLINVTGGVVAAIVDPSAIARNTGKMPSVASPTVMPAPIGLPQTNVSMDAMAEQDKAIKKQRAAVEATAKAAKDLQDRLFGADAIAQAKAYAAAIGSVQNVTKLSADTQADASKILDDALGAYKRLGIAAPEAMNQIANALRFETLKRIPALADITKHGAALQYDTMPTLAKLPKVSGGLPMAFTGKKLTAPGHGFDQVMGMSSSEFGVKFGQTIVGAVSGGGNIGDAAGSFVGAQLGESLSKKISTPAVQKMLSGALGKTLGGAASAILPGVGALVGPLVGKLGSVLSSGIEKLAGNASKKAREAFAKGLGFSDLGALYGDLQKFGEQGQALADFGMNRIGRNDAAGNAAWQKQVQAFYKATTEVLGKYGLSMDEINGKQKSLTDTIAADYERLKKLGFGDERLSKSMASGLNDTIRAALTAGTSIPKALEPVLQALIRGGGLSDDLARALLGIAEPVKRDWRAMQEAAERYGLTVDVLGSGFEAAKLDELVEQLRRDWELLAIPGARTADILAAMAPDAQRLVEASKKWGYEIPAAMKPILADMARLGLLLDGNGDKMESLDGLNFGVDLAGKIDELIVKLGELIDRLIGPDGVAAAAEEAAQRAAEADARQNPPTNTDPYLPDGSINPNGPYGYQLPDWGGAQANGGDYMVNRPTLFLAGEAGPEQISFSGANRGFGTAATVIVEVDGRTLAQTIIPVLPGELKRLRLA
jgi:hypothetical protein